jgi:hypothetical protein
MRYKFSLLLMLIALASITATAQRRQNPRGIYGSASLTGTYTLDRSRSDDPATVIDRSIRGLNPQDADRVRNGLLRRLDAPDQLAIQQSGRQISIASSNAPQATLDANGQEISETRPNGRTTRTRSTLNRDVLTISSTGDRGSDFQVTFTPTDRGRGLQVTRSFYSERVTQAIVTRSYYTRSSDTAQWDIYRDDVANNRDRDRDRDRNDNRRDDRFNDRRDRRWSIPDGAQLTAVLNEDLSTKAAQAGDRFTLTVRSPNQFDGAVIEGSIVDSDRSGRVSGKAEFNMDFQSIRFRDGRTSDFAGFVESVRTSNGETVKIDDEGSVKDKDNQTTKTVTRGGIGAALGAIIGGIAGGGKGAAIGAAVGAGAGAGTVILGGRNDLKLDRGSEFVIRSSAPSGSPR